jgi:hypothetical protein
VKFGKLQAEKFYYIGPRLKRLAGANALTSLSSKSVTKKKSFMKLPPQVGLKIYVGIHLLTLFIS